ncbi:hypothetical protein P3X46_013755 [Hevea brasiliensis]|uniref:Uncharacterized protein n=1 Tax=Hevea brasiliensis TaxID=3981 RepID=A0ABQ9M8E3_HEVBR|nr:hypothetical protein P3X46_013755 [Hevea brasiliensis]
MAERTTTQEYYVEDTHTSQTHFQLVKIGGCLFRTRVMDAKYTKSEQVYPYKRVDLKCSINAWSMNIQCPYMEYSSKSPLIFARCLLWIEINLWASRKWMA